MSILLRNQGKKEAKKFTAVTLVFALVLLALLPLFSFVEYFFVLSSIQLKLPCVDPSNHGVITFMERAGRMTRCKHECTAAYFALIFARLQPDGALVLARSTQRRHLLRQQDCIKNGTSLLRQTTHHLFEIIIDGIVDVQERLTHDGHHWNNNRKGN